MSQRSIRLNKAVCKELNILLHTLFRDAATKISITKTLVSPDLHDAYVYFSVVGNQEEVQAATKFLNKNAKTLQHTLSDRIKTKYSPKLKFRYDDSVARGQNIIKLLDNI